MSLADLPVGPVIPVSDLERSRAFYEGSLGLKGEAVPGGYVLYCGGDTRIFLLAGTDYAARAEWPLASFRADRLDAVVDELVAAGVVMAHFESGPYATDERGIADMDGVRIAWFRDPDRQVIAVFEPQA
jgi:catechol 2,3-dioxygenase-like lactoylglutathione lyase family enzyme